MTSVFGSGSVQNLRLWWSFLAYVFINIENLVFFSCRSVQYRYCGVQYMMSAGFSQWFSCSHSSCLIHLLQGSGAEGRGAVLHVHPAGLHHLCQGKLSGTVLHNSTILAGTRNVTLLQKANPLVINIVWLHFVFLLCSVFREIHVSLAHCLTISTEWLRVC